MLVKKNRVFALLPVILVFFASNGFPQAVSSITLQHENLQQQIKDHVEHLSSKLLLGRSTLTGHDRLAASYIDSLFRIFKLDPFTQYPQPQYKQSVSIVCSTPAERTLTYNGFKYSYGKDFICLGPDPDSGVDIDIVFGGYGEPHELEGLNIEGKALFILTKNLRVGALKVHEEATAKGCAMVIVANYSQSNQFDLISRQLEVDHKQTRFTLLNARNMGASRFFAQFGKPIPQVLISDNLAKRMLGMGIADIAKKLDEKQPVNPLAPGLRLKFSIGYNTQTIQTNNIIGTIPAARNTQQCVLVCAHFDHLAPDEYHWYPGADDNASGTSVLLELARYFSEKYSSQQAPARNIVFAAFTGEEIGLLGSSHFVDNVRYDIDSTLIVINLDMVGRESKKRPHQRVLFVDGKKNLVEFTNILTRFMDSEKLIIDPKGLDDETLFSVSDHYPFQQKGVPAFLFNTGIHIDYHQPTDTPEKLRYENMETIFYLLYQTIDYFANSPNPWGEK